MSDAMTTVCATFSLLSAWLSASHPLQWETTRKRLGATADFRADEAPAADRADEASAAERACCADEASAPGRFTRFFFCAAFAPERFIAGAMVQLPLEDRRGILNLSHHGCELLVNGNGV